MRDPVGKASLADRCESILRSDRGALKKQRPPVESGRAELNRSDLTSNDGVEAMLQNTLMAHTERRRSC